MVKKILKKKILPALPAPLEVRYIPAIQMEPDVEYINPLCTTIIKLKSIEQYDGVATGLQALRETVVKCTGISAMGDVEIQFNMFGSQPVIVDQPDMVKKIQHEHMIAIGKIQGLRSEKRSTQSTKVDADGKPVARKPRGEVDARTGCSAGSQGHVLGTIMLDNQCGPATREKCVSLMTAKLTGEYGFTDTKKAKALAQSWYSTLWTRKPQIYQKGR